MGFYVCLFFALMFVLSVGGLDMTPFVVIAVILAIPIVIVLGVLTLALVPIYWVAKGIVNAGRALAKI